MPSFLHAFLPESPDKKAPGRPDLAGTGSAVKPEERLLGLDILIVEDEAMLALDLSLSIEDAGAQVLGPAYSLRTAIALVQEPDFHADGAILDVDLAGSDVFPVAEKLQELGIPFLFNTGHGDRRHLTSMFPGSVVCMKPTLTDDLIARLQELLGRSKR